jgi:hypothetical protein
MKHIELLEEEVSKAIEKIAAEHNLHILMDVNYNTGRISIKLKGEIPA